jgi:RNA polymerase sigma factor (sigma-70 family)
MSVQERLNLLRPAGISRDVSAVMIDSSARSTGAADSQADLVRIAEWRAVRRAQRGDVGAFEELYRGSAGRIYALCLRMTGNREDAEELTQETFIRAWQKIAAFRGDSAFSSWLFRIAVNVVLGERRQGRRRPTSDEPVDELPLHSHEGEARTTLAIDLEKAIAALPQGARMAFVMHEVEGYRHGEIATVTGLAVGTLKAQLHRARKLLKEALLK